MLLFIYIDSSDFRDFIQKQFHRDRGPDRIRDVIFLLIMNHVHIIGASGPFMHHFFLLAPIC